MIDKQFEYLQSLKKKEEKMLDKQKEDADKKKDQEEKEKKEKFNKLVKGRYGREGSVKYMVVGKVRS